MLVNARPYCISMKVLITGGRGFIGSHLAKAFADTGSTVVLVDRTFDKGLKANRLGIELSSELIPNDILRSVDIVYHLAAEPSVRAPAMNHIVNNVLATANLLESMRKANVTSIVFTSSSVVYGETVAIPTPETEPSRPISMYGATKVAGEAILGAFEKSEGFSVGVVRLANVVGTGGHGVIPDLISKISKSDTMLEILGDGTQNKSYIHVSDCISALSLIGGAVFRGQSQTLNIGSKDAITVDQVANIVLRTMGRSDLALIHRLENDGRGWKGDVRNMCLDISKAKQMLGWEPAMKSHDAVSLATKELLGRTSP